jgi:hypothetical protein
MLADEEMQEAAAELRYDTGVDLDDDLLAHLTGEFGLALGPAARLTPWGFPPFLYEAQPLLVAEADDSRAVEQSLDAIFDYIYSEEGLDRDTTRVNGVEMTFLEVDSSSDLGLGYSVHDGLVFVGTSEDALAMAAREGEGLSTDERFGRAAGELPDHYLAFLYADVAGIQRYLNRSRGLDPEFFEEEYPGLEAIDAASFVLEPMTGAGLLAGRMNFVLGDEEE